MPEKTIDEMGRPELMERFQKICPGRHFDSCQPCNHYFACGGCTHPDQPDNILARRAKVH